MKRITKIRLSDYRAFYGLEDKFEMPNGENVLIYGENGSGKSSLYQALYDFFETSAHGYDFTKKPLIENLYRRIEVDNGVAGAALQSKIDLTFQDSESNTETDYAAIDKRLSTHQELFIQNTRLVSGFLSYKDLVGIYVGKSNRLNHFDLIITLSHNHTSSHISKTIGEEWMSLQEASKLKATPQHRDNMKIWVKNFNLALKEYLDNLSAHGSLNDILTRHFQHNVSIEFEFNGVIYNENHSDKRKRLQNDNLFFKIFYDTIDLSQYDHEYQNFLNEARLSALAISIYLSSIKSNPSILDYKILFLDDVFIGLDTSNRLPLLGILKEYFSDYQIFISTYDRHWFEVAKDWLAHKMPNKWKSFEMYSGFDENNKVQKPALYNSMNYSQKASLHLDKHDYAACANNLRKAVEKRIKEILPPNEQYQEVEDKETGLKEIRKVKNLGSLIDIFISYCHRSKVQVDEIGELKNLKDWYFNPFSHDNITSPVYRRELEGAIELVKKLESFKMEVILEAGQELYFQFSKPEIGEFREYKIRLVDNLRHIKSDREEKLTNANVECFQWTKDADIQTVTWLNNHLMAFFNNKQHLFLGSTPETDFFTVLKLSDGQPLSSKRKY